MGNKSGFTLVELVVVMMITGIIAVVAIPRLLDRKTFDSRGFADQTIAALRFAQKMAISERRAVCTTFSATSLSLTTASIAGSATCDRNLFGPSNSVGSTYLVNANAGVTYASTPTNFQFNALGQASVGQTISVTGATGSITVEQDTGYVHP